MKFIITKEDMGKEINLDKMFESVFGVTTATTTSPITTPPKQVVQTKTATAAPVKIRQRPGPKPKNKTTILKSTTVPADMTTPNGQYTTTEN